MNRTFRIALTAIAALIAAVAITAAPANASVGSMSARLSISPAGGVLYNVTVYGVVPTSTYTEALQLKNSAHVLVRLWGDDLFSDNLLFGPYDLQTVEARSNGLYFSGSIKINRMFLNEDSSVLDNYDEVYAGVRLVTWSSGSTIRSAETNRVGGYF